MKLYKSFVIVIDLIYLIHINRNSCQTYDGSHQGSTSVPTDIPSGMTYISLYDNDISYINDESFNETHTDFSTVDQLDLDANQIETVSERAYKGFQSVKTIFMYNNK